MNEIASRVGLGWTLNTEGAIIPSVRGIPDDYSNVEYINENKTIDNFLNSSDPIKLGI